MRVLLAALLFANLLALAWWQGWLAAWWSPGGEAGSRAAEIAPERLRVVPLERLGAGSAPDAAPPAPIPEAGVSAGAARDDAGASGEGAAQAGAGSAGSATVPSAGTVRP